MASNRFRYPPAPNKGTDTFSDSLVGLQFTDGTSQMTMGTFSSQQNLSITSSALTDSLESFSAPITLESLNISSTENAKLLLNSNLEVFINNDTNDIKKLVLYGSLKKRLSVATQSIVNFFPGAIFVDGIDVNNVSGYTTATNIVYDSETQETTLKVNVNYLSNPFDIEFTTNGNLIKDNVTKEQIINNLDMFGYTANTLVNVADGTVAKLRNLTKEFKNYAISFTGTVNAKEYKIIELTPQNTSTTYIELVIKGKPFGTATTTTTPFYIKPNIEKSEEQFKLFKGVEGFLMNRDIRPIYTSTFTTIGENTFGKTFYNYVDKTWPLQDDINIDVTTTKYTDYLTELSNIGDELDMEKTNLVSRFLTSPILKEFDTSGQKVEKTLQIYGRSFDDIKTYVDGIAYMTNVTYEGTNNIPNKLIKNFAQTLGWATPSTLDNDTFLNSVLGVSTPQYSGSSIGKTPAELDVELYRRILMNTSYLFKSKGTRKSIEFLLGLLGAPEALIEFNEYVVIADTKFNMDKFDYIWSTISGGSYTSGKIKYSPVLVNQGLPGWYIATATTQNPFKLYDINGEQGDYPVTKDGYPTQPRVTNNYFFQRGAGWFERTEDHQSELVIDNDNSTISGCNPTIVQKFVDFTWGGFWTAGKYSNDVKSPYLDRFWRFPHMPFGFGLNRVIDDKKSWVHQDPGLQTRDFTFKNRDAYYQTTDERLVINVKNVDLSLNVGQALVYDVWQQSVKSNCMFSGGSLPPPYPNFGGIWDSTNPQIDAKKYDFKTFNRYFWRLFIDTKNRMTINDGRTGGYPTLQQMYIDYLTKNCGGNNQYTYNKMIEYAQAMGDYWIKIIEQMVPATTLWTSGVKVQNSVFHRDKFVYRCFSLSGTVSQSATTGALNIALSGYTGTNNPQFSTMPISFPPPANPLVGTEYYNNIISGVTVNPTSSYSNSYTIDNQGELFGSEIVSYVTNLLANEFHTNKKKYTSQQIFTKQGGTDNFVCVDGFRELGASGVEWVNTYTLGNSNNSGPTDVPTRGISPTQTPNGGNRTQTPNSGGRINVGSTSAY